MNKKKFRKYAFDNNDLKKHLADFLCIPGFTQFLFNGNGCNFSSLDYEVKVRDYLRQISHSKLDEADLAFGGNVCRFIECMGVKSEFG